MTEVPAIHPQTMSPLTKALKYVWRLETKLWRTGPAQRFYTELEGCQLLNCIMA